MIGARFDAKLFKHIQQTRARETMAQVRHGLHESVIVTVLNHDKTIREIGFNDPAQDLILDNFGDWLAALIRTPVSSVVAISLIDVNNSSQSFNIFNNATVGGTNAVVFNSGGTALLGTLMQVGRGSTPPARGNYKIETNFTLPPLNTQFVTGAGSYSSGAISFAGAATAAEVGTVSEAGFFAQWCIANAYTAKIIMLFHDLISPTVDFIVGNTVTCSYSISL